MAEHDDRDPAGPTERTEPVYSDLPADGVTTPDTTTAVRRRGPDPLALVVGLATLAMAVFAFVGLSALAGTRSWTRWYAGYWALLGLVAAGHVALRGLGR